MSRRLVDELGMVAVKTNYGQMPHGVHALVGAVSLAGAEGELWSVQGGNRRVAEELLERSRAQLVRAKVNAVSPVAGSSSMYSVSFNRVEGEGEGDVWLFDEASDDKEAREVIKVEGEEEGVEEEGEVEERPFVEASDKKETREMIKVDAEEEVEEFDMVILATPMTQDKTNIEIRGLPDSPRFPGRCVARS